MATSDDPLQLTASELRLAIFRLARRLRFVRAVDSISDAQLAVLGTLRAHGQLTISALAEHERVTAPSMTNMINGLEEQGHVSRAPDERDRRRVQVDITDAGAAIVVETIRRRDESLAEMLAEHDFTPDELTTLRNASALIRRVIEK